MSPPKELNVLLVEDDEVDVLNFTRAFQKCSVKYQLNISSNGEEAWNGLTSGRYGQVHFVLMDLNMPRMNGLELLREIRAHSEWKHLPVFVLTTSDEAMDKEAAFGLNVAGYLVKPSSSKAFSDSIERLISFAMDCEFR